MGVVAILAIIGFFLFKDKQDYTIKSIIRWILLIPVSILAGILTPSLINFMYELIYIPLFGEGILIKYAQFMGSRFVGGFSSVYVGITIAPFNKRFVGIGLTSLFIILPFLNILLGFNSLPPVQYLIENIPTLIGIIFCFSIFVLQKDNE